MGEQIRQNLSAAYTEENPVVAFCESRSSYGNITAYAGA